MTIRTHHGRGVWLACAIALVACGGSHVGTETDNPSPKHPKYQSPGQFGGPGGDVPTPGGCVPPVAIGKPAHMPLWGQDGALLIGADMWRGMVAIDASDPAHAQLKSVTPLTGEAHQIIVEPNAQITLAIDEVPVGARDDVPSPTALQPTPRLVRFDATDPTKLERVADIALEGDFWSMRMRGSTLWVMSETVVEPVTSCNRQPYDCGYVSPTALIVAGYELKNGAWQRVARAELKTTGPAWELRDGYAAVEAHHDDNGNAQPGTLRFVRFDGDASLGDPGMITLPGEVVPGAPIGVSDTLAHVFTLDYEHGNSQLVTIDVNSGEIVSMLDDLQRQQFDDSVFVGDRLFMGGGQNGDNAQLIEWSDPTAPTIHAFPQGITRAIPLADGTRVLGLTQPPQLTASLFALHDGSPELLGQVDINPNDPAESIESVHLIGDRIAVGFYRLPDHALTTVVLEAGDTTLARVAAVQTYGDELLAVGDTYFVPDWSGLNPTGGTDTLSWSRDIIDDIGAVAYRATLVRDTSGNVLELRKGGTLVDSLDVGPAAERLIGDDQHVLVLSLEPRDQCEQSGADCKDYAPNVAIVTLGDKPSISATIELTDPDALGASGTGETRVEWDPEGDIAFALGNGRFVLVGDYYASCSSADECKALGVEPQPTNQALPAAGGPTPPPTPPCAPGASCAPLPVPAPVVSSSVYGEKHATRLYLLDTSAAQPRLSDPVDSALELNGSRFAPPRVSEGTLMITRIERERVIGMDSGSQPAHFMLDRFVVEDGKLRALEPVNVPGFPIALASGGSLLYSAEPDGKMQGAGKLYMLALDDDGAHALDEAPLDASYSDAFAASGRLFYLRHDGIDCAGKSTLLPFALPDNRDGKLRALPAFELLGGRYRIADARDDQLLLMDDQSHYVVVDVSGDTPRFVKFLSAPAGPSRPTLQGDRIFGGRSLYADDLTF